MDQVQAGALQAISVAFSIWSIWALGDRKRYGWTVKALGQATAIPLNLLAGLYIYAGLCLVGVAMSLWSWRKWGVTKMDSEADWINVTRAELGVLRSTLHKLNIYARNQTIHGGTVPIWDHDDDRALEMLDEIRLRNIR